MNRYKTVTTDSIQKVTKDKYEVVSRHFEMHYDLVVMLGKVEFFIDSREGLTDLELFIFTPQASKWHHIDTVKLTCDRDASIDTDYDKVLSILESDLKEVERIFNIYASVVAKGINN